MRKILILVAIGCLIPWFSHAQVSGYLGKRCIVNYQVSLFPAFSGNWLNNMLFDGFPDNAPIPFRLLSVHGLHTQYVIGRRQMAGLNIGYGVAHPKAYYMHGGAISWYPVSLKNYSVGLEYSAYLSSLKGNPIAPVGRYIRVCISRVWVHAIDPKSFVGMEEVPDTTKTKLSEGTFKGYSYSIALGSSRIIAHTVYFDFNTQVQLGLLEDAPFIEDHPRPSLMFTKYYTWRYSLGFNIGIGGLLF